MLQPYVNVDDYTLTIHTRVHLYKEHSAGVLNAMWFSTLMTDCAAGLVLAKVL